MVLVLFKGTRTQNLIWKKSNKGIGLLYDFEKKNEKVYF